MTSANLHSAAPALSIRDVSRSFGSYHAVSRVSLDIAQGEFFSLIGPSGCGKTTLLRMVAGLEVPESGSILILGADSASIPPHRRPVNMVFQSYALFPHMNVRKNIGFGLRMKGMAQDEAASRVEAVMELVQITRLSDRMPAQISGGEKQRVALARAIVNEPKVLLLDEPLGALDLKLRRELQVELRGLQRRLGISFLYVTHDQEEALAMSDRIGVMDRGELRQIGAASELYELPKTRFVSQFLGTSNLLEGTVRSTGGVLAAVVEGLGTLPFADHRGDVARRKGERVTLAIRPERIVIAEVGAANAVSASVRETAYAGASTRYVVSLGERTLVVEASNHGDARKRYVSGDAINLLFPAEALIPLED